MHDPSEEDVAAEQDTEGWSPAPPESAGRPDQTGEVPPGWEGSSQGMNETEVRRILESLLFVSPAPLTLDRLTALLEAPSKKEIARILRVLQEDYERDQRGWQLVELAGGFQLVTPGACGPWVKKLTKEKTQAKLSRSAMETLAIIAYNQPIIRSQIEDIRGVESAGVLRTLLDQRLIRIAGRKEIPGRPLMYGTTKQFLLRFGLRDLSSLPPLRDIKALGEPENMPLPLEYPPTSNGDGQDPDHADDPRQQAHVSTSPEFPPS